MEGVSDEAGRWRLADGEDGEDTAGRDGGSDTFDWVMR